MATRSEGRMRVGIRRFRPATHFDRSMPAGICKWRPARDARAARKAAAPVGVRQTPPNDSGLAAPGALYRAPMQTFVAVLIILALLMTLGVLVSGLIVMARGGELNRKYGNKLMRWRIICQGIALGLLAVAFLLGGGN
jgi:hypothetical protein